MEATARAKRATARFHFHNATDADTFVNAVEANVQPDYPVQLWRLDGERVDVTSTIGGVRRVKRIADFYGASAY